MKGKKNVEIRDLTEGATDKDIVNFLKSFLSSKRRADNEQLWLSHFITIYLFV